MEEQKENVRATILALDLGESHDFPLERYEYVVSCRTSLQTSTGNKYSSAKLIDEKVVRITRNL